MSVERSAGPQRLTHSPRARDQVNPVMPTFAHVLQAAERL